jgi:hypothetical protein
VPAAQGGAGNQQSKGKKRALEEEEEAPLKETSRLIRALHIRLRLTTQQREQVILAIAVQRAAFNFAAELVNMVETVANDAFVPLRFAIHAFVLDVV